MTDTLVPTVAAADTLRSAIASGARPEAVGALPASLAFAWRAMLKIKHVPVQLFDVTAFPIMFVLLYTYLFGGALAESPREYLQELLPGILVMTVSMITMYSGVALNHDIQKGIFDRVRTMPVWRPAALVGMLMADVVRYSAASVVVLVVGLILGFRPDGTVGGVVLTLVLLLVFCFSLSWLWLLLVCNFVGGPLFCYDLLL